MRASNIKRRTEMEWQLFSDNPAALAAQTLVFAQAACTALIVLTRLPSMSPINQAARFFLASLWLMTIINIGVDMPDNFDDWLNGVAAVLLTCNGVLCLVNWTQHPEQSLKSHVQMLIFGLLHPSPPHKTVSLNRRRA